jgi:hypothetical protein
MADHRLVRGVPAPYRLSPVVEPPTPTSAVPNSPSPFAAYASYYQPLYVGPDARPLQSSATPGRAAPPATDQQPARGTYTVGYRGLEGTGESNVADHRLARGTPAPYRLSPVVDAPTPSGAVPNVPVTTWPFGVYPSYYQSPSYAAGPYTRYLLSSPYQRAFDVTGLQNIPSYTPPPQQPWPGYLMLR